MRVGIVGAGITGLVVHHTLRERGVDSVLWEAADQPGGVIETETLDGRVLEYGPQRTRLTPGIEDLVDAFDLREHLRVAPDLPLFVYHDGALRQAPLSVRSAVTTSLLSVPGKLRVLLEPLAGPPKDGETVDEYFRRAFGREVAERLAGPLYAGLYASDPAEMPVEHSLARALETFGVDGSILAAALRSRLRGRSPPPAVSFDDGLQSLPTAMARRYADSVTLGRAVTGVRSTGAGYRLETEAGGTVVDHVVLTTPAGETARLLAALDDAAVAGLDSLSYNPLAVVHLDTTLDRSAMGYQVALGEDLVTRGVTFNDALFDRDGVVTCYLGGATNPGVLDWHEDRIGRVAASEFERATGAEASVRSVRKLQEAMPAYDTSWSALEEVSLPEGVHLCANYESRAGIPGRIRAARSLAKSITEAGPKLEDSS